MEGGRDREMRNLPVEVALGVEPVDVEPGWGAQLLELVVVDGHIREAVILNGPWARWSADGALEFKRTSQERHT